MSKRQSKDEDHPDNDEDSKRICLPQQLSEGSNLSEALPSSSGSGNTFISISASSLNINEINENKVVAQNSTVNVGQQNGNNQQTPNFWSVEDFLKKNRLSQPHPKEKFNCPQMRKNKFYENPVTEDEETDGDDEDGDLEEDKIELENILHGEEKYVALHGEVGSGKSTIVEEFVARVNHGKIDYLKDIQHVVYLKGKEIRADDKLTLQDFLMDNSDKLSKCEKKATWEYLQKKPEKMLICIDGIDEFDGSFDNYSTQTALSEKKMPVDWIKKMFSSACLKGAYILTSSRDERLLSFSKTFRPQKTIRLVGFRKEDILSVLKQKVEDENLHAKIQRKLKKNKYLFGLCSNPLFLHLISLVFEKMHNEEKPFPNTVSGVMINLLLNLVNSDHFRKINDQCGNFLPNIAEMTFNMRKKKSLKITQEDCSEYGIVLEDMQDLTMAYVQKSHSVVRDKIFQGNKELIFVHKFFAEILAAVHVLLMSGDDFKEWLAAFNDDDFLEEWQISLGLLLNDNIKNQRHEFLKLGCGKYDEEMLKERSTIALDSLKTKVPLTINRDHFKLFAVLGETNNVELHKRIKSINLEGTILSMKRWVNVSRVISLCTTLEGINLFGCDINSNHIDTIKEAINNKRPVKIMKLDLRRNCGVVCESLGNIAKLCKVEKLDLYQCGIEENDLEDFGKGIKDGTSFIKWINLAENDRVVCRELALALKNMNLDCIDLYKCRVDEEKLDGFHKGLRTPKIRIQELKLRRNKYALCEDLGRIAVKCNVKKIDFGECSVGSESLKQFADGALEEMKRKRPNRPPFNEQMFSEFHFCGSNFQPTMENIISEIISGVVKYGPRMYASCNCCRTMNV